MHLRKIGFFVSDKRHFDYFKNVFEAMHEKEVPFDMIVNDTRNEAHAIITDEYNRSMMEIAKKLGYPSQLLSEVVQSKAKYQYLVTTYSFKYSIRTDPPKLAERFIFEFVRILIRIARVLKLSFLQSVFNEKLNRYYFRFRKSPEKAVGEKIILFPKGLDLKIDKFPDPAVLSEVDEYFCHGKIDAELIREKTSKTATIIGYPRYDTLNFHRDELVSDLIQEFRLDRSKKLISWIPTYVLRNGNPDFNFDNWMPYIYPLLEDFEIIVRPHPKRIEFGANELLERLQKLGFHVDILAERDMNQLYAASDFILCDYGGVVFSSLYTDSNLIMLNHAEHDDEFERQKHLLVYQVREKLLNLNISELKNNPSALNLLLNDIGVWNKQKSERKLLREEYFGGVETGVGSQLAASKLQELLEK